MRRALLLTMAPLVLVGCGSSAGSSSASDAGPEPSGDASADGFVADSPAETASDSASHTDGGATADGAVDPCASRMTSGPLCEGSTLYTCSGGKTVSATSCPRGCATMPATGLDACVPPKLGVYVWDFGVENDPAPTVAKTAAALGIGFVMIKSGEDEAVWTGNFNSSIVSEFTSQGIEVWGIVYVRPGTDLAAKANAIAQEANVTGATGVILDAEWEWDGTSGEATTLCKGIRAQIGKKKLAYNPQFNWPYGGQYELSTPQFFSNYPWKEFDTYCGDATLPQVYYDENGGSYASYANAWSFTVKGYASLGLKAPIWGMQDNDDGASVGDQNAFFALAGDHSSVFRWPNSGSPLLEQMEEIRWRGDASVTSYTNCPGSGMWCGKSSGGPGPQGAKPNDLFSCPGSGKTWEIRATCGTCYTCGTNVPDTCDPTFAQANGCK